MAAHELEELMRNAVCVRSWDNGDCSRREATHVACMVNAILANPDVVLRADGGAADCARRGISSGRADWWVGSG